MQQTIATFALVVSLGAPAMAQMTTGQLAVLTKVDALSSGQGPAQLEAAMASCLAFGAQPEVLKTLLAEAGWALNAEYSDDYNAYFAPSSDPASPMIELGLQAQTCGLDTQDLGGEAAQVMAKALLDQWSASVTTQVEGTPPESCTKHEGKVTWPVKGTIYLSVLDTSGEEWSCLPNPQNSLTTFAFVPD